MNMETNQTIIDLNNLETYIYIYCLQAFTVICVNYIILFILNLIYFIFVQIYAVKISFECKPYCLSACLTV